jgi:hypothetical protein
MSKPRLKGWERRLILDLEVELSLPFDWRYHNCGHLICASIRACIGEHDIMRYLVGLESEQQVMDLLGREGGVSGIVGQWFNVVPHYMAQDGDVAVIDTKYYDRHATEVLTAEVGCVVLGGRLVGKREKGVFRLPLQKAKLIYHV